MKVFIRKVIKGTNWALAGLMAFLGYSCSKDIDIFDDNGILKEKPDSDPELVCAYGSPHASYKVMGTVTDEDGQALEGIRVIVPELNNCTKILDYNRYREERHDTLITDQQGAYNYEVPYWSPTDSLQIKFQVEDPAEKYEALNDSVKFSMSDLNDGDGSAWLVGRASKEKNFVLKQKDNHE